MKALPGVFTAAVSLMFMLMLTSSDFLAAMGFGERGELTTETITQYHPPQPHLAVTQEQRALYASVLDYQLLQRDGVNYLEIPSGAPIPTGYPHSVVITRNHQITPSLNTLSDEEVQELAAFTENSSEALVPTGGSPATSEETSFSGNVETFTIRGDALAGEAKNRSEDLTVLEFAEGEILPGDSVGDAVKEVSGALVSRTGGALQPALLSLRGSSDEQVLVLKDGRRLNSAQGGGVDLSAVPLYGVKYIEIIKGAATAKYGENAVGGVINIITDDAAEEGLKWSAGFTIGSWNTHALNADIRGVLPLQVMKEDPLTGAKLPFIEQALDYSLVLGGLYSDSDFSYQRIVEGAGSSDDDEDGGDLEQSLERENAGGLRGNAGAEIGWDISRAEQLRLELFTEISGDSRGVPGTIEFPDDTAVMEDQLFAAGMSFTYGNNPIAALDVDGGLRSQERVYDPDPESEIQDDASRHENLSLSTGVQLHRSDRFGLLKLETFAGYDLRSDRLRSSSLLLGDSSGTSAAGDIQRIMHSAYLRPEFSLFVGSSQAGEADARSKGISPGGLPIRLNPSFRISSASTTAPNGDSERRTETAWSLGAVFPLPGGGNSKGFFSGNRDSNPFIVKANIGTAYRVPSFDDLFWPSTAFAVGNPYLEPEESLSWDLALLFDPSAEWFSSETVYFHRNVSNLIQWYPSGTGQWTPQNVGKAEIQGIDASVDGTFKLPISDASWFDGDLSYRIGGSWLQALNKTPGANYDCMLTRRPKTSAHGRLTYSRSRGGSFSLQTNFVGYRWYTAQNTKYIPGYLVLNASLKGELFPGWAAELSVENILDEAYVDMHDVPIPGRKFSLSVTYRGSSENSSALTSEGEGQAGSSLQLPENDSVLRGEHPKSSAEASEKFAELSLGEGNEWIW